MQASLFDITEKNVGLAAQEVGFVNTPFNYTGSKFPILAQILPLFDYTKPYFIDLFAGGGSVYSNVAHRYERVVANDIIGDLMAIQHRLINDTEATVEKVKSLCVAKDDQAGYHALRDAYNADKTPEALYALMLCCNCNMLRFNRRFEFNQTHGKRTFNASTQAKLDSWTAHMKPLVSRIKFLSKSFTNVWPSTPSQTFFYIDPPYSCTEAGYNSFWSQQQEEYLYEYILRIHREGGTFAVSGVAGEHGERGEAWLIRKLIDAGFHVTEIDHAYGKVAKVKDKAMGQEVLIRNFA